MIIIIKMEELKQYGKVGIITHLALSWTFFAGLCLFVNQSKHPEKLINYLKLQDKVPKNARTFVVSAIIYKAVMPLRIGVSILAVPLVIKTFGITVTPPEEPPLATMIE